MGIQNLLHTLKFLLEKRHLSEFRNQRIAIDGMSWLFKGAYSCALELSLKQETDQYLGFMLKMLNTFRFYAIMPVVVFDGRKLKEKEKTHEKRTKNKDACAKIAYEYLEKGNTEMARKYFMKGISINRKMINTAVDLIKSLGVECMVAPYEADAQLSNLVKIGYCSAAITEDSDLICYLCNQVLFKLQPDGFCQYINTKQLREDREYRKLKIPDEHADFRIWFSLKEDQFIDCCILAGCDYTDGIKGMGLVTAIKNIYLNGSIEKVIQKLKYTKNADIQKLQDYLDLHLNIRYVMKHQMVYDPIQNQVSSLFKGPEIVGDHIDNLLDYINGLIDPYSMEPREQDPNVYQRLIENKKMAPKAQAALNNRVDLHANPLVFPQPYDPQENKDGHYNFQQTMPFYEKPKPQLSEDQIYQIQIKQMEIRGIQKQQQEKDWQNIVEIFQDQEDVNISEEEIDNDQEKNNQQITEQQDESEFQPQKQDITLFQTSRVLNSSPKSNLPKTEAKKSVINFAFQNLSQVFPTSAQENSSLEQRMSKINYDTPKEKEQKKKVTLDSFVSIQKLKK